MIIDEDILKDGIDEVLLAKLIGKHSLEQERYEKLYNYYIGKHAICERRRSKRQYREQQNCVQSREVYRGYCKKLSCRQSCGVQLFGRIRY